MNLIEVKAQPNYRLFVRYGDGACGDVDLSGFAGKGVFAAWNNPDIFEQVFLAEAGHPEWPGGLDLCPDFLYMQLTGKRPEQLFPALKDILAHA